MYGSGVELGVNKNKPSKGLIRIFDQKRAPDFKSSAPDHSAGPASI